METFIFNNWMKNQKNEWEKTLSNYTMPDKGKIYSKMNQIVNVGIQLYGKELLINLSIKDILLDG